MHSRIHEFEKVESYFEPKCKSYESYVVVHKVSRKKFLMTRYNLQMMNMPSKLLQERLLFLCQNYKLFRCEAVFFHNHLPSLDVLKPPVISKFINYFYVVEPLPMVSLVDYATINAITRDFLFKNLPAVLNTIAALHSVRFPYLNLSPFSIIVDDTFSLRPPPLNPFASPKSALPPPPKVHRSDFRSINETRFYQSPEWNSVKPFCPSDSWALGAILAEYLIFGGPVFGSLNREDQMKRTQLILGAAPDFLNWAPAPITVPCDLPSILLELLDYDPQKRPWLCVHFCQRVLAFVHGNGPIEESEGEPEPELEQEAVPISHINDLPMAYVQHDDDKKDKKEKKEKKEKKHKHKKQKEIVKSESASVSSTSSTGSIEPTVTMSSPISNATSSPIASGAATTSATNTTTKTGSYSYSYTSTNYSTPESKQKRDKSKKQKPHSPTTSTPTTTVYSSSVTTHTTTSKTSPTDYSDSSYESKSSNLQTTEKSTPVTYTYSEDRAYSDTESVTTVSSEQSHESTKTPVSTSVSKPTSSLDESKTIYSTIGYHTDSDYSEGDPYSAPFTSTTGYATTDTEKTSHRVTFTDDKNSIRKTTTTEDDSDGSSSYSPRVDTSSSVMETSREVDDLRKRIAALERSFSQSKRERTDSDDSESSSQMELFMHLQDIKDKVNQIDKVVLDGCQGCEDARHVDHNLHRQQYMLGNTMDELSTNSSSLL